MTCLSTESGSLQWYTRGTTTTASICYYPQCKKCSIYNQCIWAAILQEFWLKFWQESSTPLHSKRCRWRTTWIRTILKCTLYSPMTGTSFRVNLARICGEPTKLRACQKVPTDRQTVFRLYIVDIRLISDT